MKIAGYKNNKLQVIKITCYFLHISSNKKALLYGKISVKYNKK